MALQKRAKAIVVSGDGINCDAETVFGLELAGFEPELIHDSDLLNDPAKLMTAQLLAVPGGFSFADEIASGKVLALKLKDKLKSTLYDFVEKGNLIIGICNGFQILVQLGLLPDSRPEAARLVSLCRNSSGKFINKWVQLDVSNKSNEGFFAGLRTIHLPIRHGEGRLALASGMEAILANSIKGQAPLRYAEDVNGSFDRIAALTNKSGNVLGLMPHPEAFVRWNQHPSWYQIRNGLPGGEGALALTQPLADEIPHGLRILKNAAGMLS